ncbi:hypothetical protein K461DRAFT_295923 [Myriangium duriaei CBS 260.36]|uniref:F-box domain-containing protein n=1 Tax=Myriangium duriaei CBS 260.36 TaxID=1168546 RepID=A0A9P4IXJ0_9PEZI|nr:hypothetical protein K461DRAFT_295923 [Myriangium duriaei CBS 260.36]
MSPLSFDALPPEILLNVLYRINDLASLDDILRASPAAWRIFNSYGVDITDRVLNSGRMHSHIVQIIRVIADIRHDCFPICNLEDFQYYLCRTAVSRDRVDEPRECMECYFINDGHRCRPDPCESYLQSRARFPAKATSATARKIIHTARHILALTSDCLELYLQRFRKSASSSHVHNDEAVAELIHTLEAPHARRSIEMQPAPDFVRDIGQPMWLEEQIVHRAFYRIQLIKELKRALRDGTITSWPNDDVDSLLSMDSADICGLEQEALDVVYYEHAGVVNSENTYETTEHGAFVAAEEYMSENGSQPPLHSWSRPWRAPASQTPDIKDIKQQCSGLENMMCHGRTLFKSVYGRYPENLAPSFVSYRRLGFGIWSLDRLVQCGFAVKSEIARVYRPCISAWVRLLTPDEVAKLNNWDRGRPSDAELYKRWKAEWQQHRAERRANGRSEIDEDLLIDYSDDYDYDYSDHSEDEQKWWDQHFPDHGRN